MLAKTTTLALLCVATNALRIHNTDLNLDTPSDALEFVEKMDTDSDGVNPKQWQSQIHEFEANGAILRKIVPHTHDAEFLAYYIENVCPFVPEDPLCPSEDARRELEL